MRDCTQPTITAAGIRSLGSNIEYINVINCSQEVKKAAREFGKANVADYNVYYNDD